MANERNRLRRNPQIPAGFCFYAPNRVQGVLKLTENATSAEKREGDTDDRGDGTFPRLRRLLRDVLDHLNRARVEKIAHLLCDLVPGSRCTVPENDPDGSEQDENQRRERKDRVVCGGRAATNCGALSCRNSCPVCFSRPKALAKNDELDPDDFLCFVTTHLPKQIAERRLLAVPYRICYSTI